MTNDNVERKARITKYNQTIANSANARIFNKLHQTHVTSINNKNNTFNLNEDQKKARSHQ